MKFDDATITEFILLYEEIFEEQLTIAEASEMVFRLVNLYMRLTEQLPSERCVNATCEQMVHPHDAFQKLPSEQNITSLELLSQE